ncbi:hypothetical protein [Maledivibacter halophilus]|uniref:Uncharacterized protein n=1 Tax=Maledivibacter halophilus TaxID=36842 RepID=A0A1T5JGP1_9FIRM|nr:hypothetical protein [Maledivibacter halophilus]SKC50610.1 hypothetical protein SAMN02194393_01173 [Maledivibacter halophilus]
MNKIKPKKSLAICLSTIALAGSFFVISGSGFMGPGSDDDPIVTLSYVEKRIEQIKYYINQNIETINNETMGLKTRVKELEGQSNKSNLIPNESNISVAASPSKFEVVAIEAGQILKLGESSEVIWRSGKATAIASENGGLLDVTIGKDIKTGEEIPLHHLLIIPRNDGRGMTVTAKSFVMIKGTYAIQ